MKQYTDQSLLEEKIRYLNKSQKTQYSLEFGKEKIPKLCRIMTADNKHQISPILYLPQMSEILDMLLRHNITQT